MAARELTPTTDDLVAHAGFVRALARRILLDDDRADDVVQEALLAAMNRSGETVRRGWLAGVAKNLARMRIRGDDRRKKREARVAAGRPSPSSPDEIAARLEMQKRLVAAVHSLAEPYRATIVLRYFDGLEPKEIATKEGVPAATVRTRIHRALAMLRGRLDSEHDGDRRRWSLALLSLAMPERSALPVAGGAATAAAIGGTMTLKKGMVIGALAVAAALFGVWVASGPLARDPAPAVPPAVTDVAGGSGEEPESEPEKPPLGGPGSVEGPTDEALHGIVVDAAGAAVPGVSLEARRPAGSGFTLTVEDILSPEVLATGTSDKDGSFRLDLGGALIADIVAAAPDGSSGFLPLCGVGPPVRVVLEPGTRVEIVVRDEGGLPVPGVGVYLVRAWFPDHPVLDREGTTNADGRIVFDGVAAGMVMPGFRYARLGHPVRTKWVIRRGERQKFDVTLPAGRSVAGRVHDSVTGEPVPDAIVAEHAGLFRSVRSGPDGRYLLEGFTGWISKRVHVVAEGYARASAELPEIGDLDFALDRGFVARGRVVSEGGEPISDARVEAQAYRATTNLDLDIDQVVAASGEDGRFRLECLRTDLGAHVLTVRRPGRGTARLQFERSAGDAETDLGDILLPPGRVIAGTARDGSGEPMPRAAVKYASMEGRLMPGRRTSAAWKSAQGYALTDADGRFRFADLSPGRHLLFLTGPGGAGARLDVVVPPAEDLEDVVLALASPRAAGSLTILVSDEDGKPIPGVRVHAGPSNRTTGADGRAAFTGLTGPIQVQLSPPRSGEGRFHPDSVGPFEADGRTVTVILKEGALVSGRVIGPEGVDLSRLIVTALEAGTWQVLRPTVCDALGRFETLLHPGMLIDLAVDGTRLSKDYMRPESWLAIEGEARAIRAPATGVTIRTTDVEEKMALTVRVLDPDGEPVAGIEITARRRASQTLRWDTPTGEDGRVRLEGLRSKPFEFSVPWSRELPKGAVSPAPVRVVPEGQEVVLRLQKGVAVRGVALDMHGNPVAGCAVFLRKENRYLGRATADAEGRFELFWPRGEVCDIVASSSQGGRRLMARMEDVDPAAGEITIRLAE